jgi:hypothetical protein
MSQPNVEVRKDSPHYSTIPPPSFFLLSPLPRRSPEILEGAKAGVFCILFFPIIPLFQHSIIPAFYFFLTSPRFPYKFPNKPNRYLFHQQLNPSSLSNSPFPVSLHHQTSDVIQSGVYRSVKAV